MYPTESRHPVRLHFASAYRWYVATRHWRLPSAFAGRVLDIGSDEGGFVDRLKADFKVSVDIRRVSVAGSPFVQADAVALPFRAEHFEHVMAFDILEHVVADGTLLNEAIRVLRPGGTLWLSSTARSFFVFPGGAVQRRFERSWGHVRRGYDIAELLVRLPPGVTTETMSWNEPCFRFFYVCLWLVSKVNRDLAACFARLVSAIDKRHSHGQAGHLYVRVLKEACNQ